MSKPADQKARQRFAQELERNFSVVASAGSGKTRAITDRIVALARSSAALEQLPQLVVVTYTNRAADEMQQRTREQILEAGLSLEVIEAFNRAFFGTIHSFCVKLLAAYGYHLGLPANLELITDDADLWNQFVQQQTSVGRSLGEENRRVLLRHVQARQLMELARNSEVDLTAIEPDGPCPDTDFSEVLAAVAKGAAMRTIPKAQAELKRWEKRWRETDEFVPWPARISNAGDFVRRWREAFGPLRDWVNACALCVAAEVQRAYRDFRLERGVVTYADQVALAGALIREPAVVRQIREKNYRVILDEAQDTRPPQFFVLLEITRPLDATAPWPEDRQLPPRPGHFCMVGDFQQAIFGESADLAHYRELHDSLIAAGAAEALEFSVTFRLDQAALDFVNATFPAILHQREGQVQFVRLNARPENLPGQMVRLDLGSEVDLAALESQRAAQEARELAAWLQEQGLAKLRAESWQQVAILSPRKAWLRPLHDALLAVGLTAEVQSESELQAENPAYAWLTALLAIMVDPNAHYEVVGVLREIFGLADDELARFANGEGARFQIAERTNGRGTVSDTLNLLTRIRLTITQQPLFSAVQEIVRMTQLRERLCSLPAGEFGDLGAELDRLLSTAAAAEAEYDSLADFARTLRTSFRAIRERTPSSANAIQLITAHKAKGSEWQAVVVPFLTRKVWNANPPYPRLVQLVADDQSQIFFDKADYDESAEVLELAERQKMERLLYVALTRAKHTVVLACDRQFFPKSGGKIHSNAQLKWLQADSGESNEVHFAGLLGEVAACVETASRQKKVSPVQTAEDFGGRELGWIDRARQTAADFCRTVSPSKFTPAVAATALTSDDIWLEVEPELRPARIDNPATRYGVWWHDLVRQIPWLVEASKWDEVFKAHQATSPDGTRGAREWQLLRQRVSQLSDFLDAPSHKSPVLRTEMPFSWKMRDDRCLEGFIDLALFDRATEEWFIIDWKTNRIARDKLDSLGETYRPQLAAYARAITATTGQRAHAAIYSTATGQFVRYAEEELIAEWKRLEALPAEELFAELSDIAQG